MYAQASVPLIAPTLHPTPITCTVLVLGKKCLETGGGVGAEAFWGESTVLGQGKINLNGQGYIWLVNLE